MSACDGKKEELSLSLEINTIIGNVSSVFSHRRLPTSPDDYPFLWRWNCKQDYERRENWINGYKIIVFFDSHKDILERVLQMAGLYILFF